MKTIPLFVEVAPSEVKVSFFLQVVLVEKVDLELADFYSNYKVSSDFHKRLQFTKSFA